MKSLTLFVLFLLSCGQEIQPETQTLNIEFRGEVNGDLFQCGTVYTVGKNKDSATIRDFRFYLSNIELIDDAGQPYSYQLINDDRFQSSSVALIDFEDGSAGCADSGNSQTNKVIVGDVEKKTFRKIRFTLGVPFSENHIDAGIAKAPLNSPAMFWVWQGGYKFFRSDLVSKDGTAYNLHLGSTLCKSAGPTIPPSEECGRSNRLEVELDFDPSTQVIVADIGKLLSNQDIKKNTKDTPPGCQSFPKDEMDCTSLFNDLGLDFNSGKCISGCKKQQLFSSKKK